jgi:hypothetical protein
VRIRPLPDSAAAAIKAGCEDTGIGVTIGCGACPPGSTKAEPESERVRV